MSLSGEATLYAKCCAFASEFSHSENIGQGFPSWRCFAQQNSQANGFAVRHIHTLAELLTLYGASPHAPPEALPLDSAKGAKPLWNPIINVTVTTR